MGYTKMNRHNYPDIEGLTEAERAKLDHIDDIEDDLADAYDSTATYAVGDWCIRNGKLYECITAIATAEPFDSTKWRRVAVAELKSNLTELLEWKYLTEISPTSAGAVDIAIPTGAREIYVYSRSVKAPIIINCAELDSTDKYFQAGFYLTANNFGGVAVQANSSKINYQTQTFLNAYASGKIVFYYR